ncbi:MAG: HNH endonuclease, partial [Burkholderiaceae bacterium]
MQPSMKMLSKNYQGFGRCIYCTQVFPTNELTREHIVPLALNGTLVIENAACKPCQTRSNESYENAALQANFLVPRLLLELKRRKKKVEKHLPLVAIGNVANDATAIFDLELDLAQYPPYIPFLRLKLPGRLEGIERDGNLSEVRTQFVPIQKASSVPLSGITTRTKLDHTAFGLTVAKIAFCFAIAERGLEAIDLSELRDLLLGKRSDLYNYVGSP